MIIIIQNNKNLYNLYMCFVLVQVMFQLSGKTEMNPYLKYHNMKSGLFAWSDTFILGRVRVLVLGLCPELEYTYNSQIQYPLYGLLKTCYN